MTRFSYWGPVVYVEMNGSRLIRGFNPNLITADECEAKIQEVIATAGVMPVILPYDWAVLGGEIKPQGIAGDEFFSDMCDVVIYHFADVAHQRGDLRSRANRRLVEAGYTTNGRTIDPERVYAVYEACVLGYGKQLLGPTWTREHDYWGAVCLHDGPIPSGDQRKDHVLVGDTTGRVMFFTGMQALREYMHAKANVSEAQPVS